MKKRGAFLMSLGLLCTTGLSLVSCNNTEETGYTYTLRDAWSASPTNFNVHNWQLNDDSAVMSYTEMGFYDFILNDTKDGYTIVPEMADGELIDDTENLTSAEIEQYNLAVQDDGAPYTSGQKWVINLNPDAVWENGEAINADTYIESFSRLLDPEMQNYRASGWYDGDFSVANAEARFKSGRTVYESIVNADAGFTTISGERVDDKVYGSLYTVPAWIGYDVNTLVSSYGIPSETASALLADTDTWGTPASPKYVNLTDNQDLYNKYVQAWSELIQGGFGVSLTPGERTAPDGNIYATDLFFMCVSNPVVEFEDVGLKKTGDYQITFYTTRPCTEWLAHYSLTSNFIVYVPLYDELTTTVGSLKATTYGTNADTYMSYGPYKLDSYTLDKELIFVKNEEWYGYSDGEHEGQFQTDRINVQIVPEMNTILSMFEKGEIDSYSLRNEDVAKYGMSSRLLYTPQSYTDKIAINSDFGKLKERQGSTNKTILNNKSFRQALSWALDRETFVQTQTAGSAVALGVINYMYVADQETGKLYRDYEDAEAVIKNVYGDSENGFDIEKARELIIQACNEENAKTTEGSYKLGDSVVFEWGVYNEGWDTAIQFVIDCWTKATVGTPLEGKFTVNMTHDADYQDKLYAGDYDFGMDIWGGAEFNPYGIPDTWLNPSTRAAYGFNPDAENLFIDLNENGVEDEGEVMSNTAWYDELNNGSYSAARADTDTRVKILAGLEQYILENQYYIAQRARQSLSLVGFKVEYPIQDYLQLVGFGGIRFMTHNYTDAEWASYVSSNTLDYSK